jgi:hypothetical protein
MEGLGVGECEIVEGMFLEIHAGSWHLAFAFGRPNLYSARDAGVPVGKVESGSDERKGGTGCLSRADESV